MLWPGWAGSGVGSRQWVVVISGQAGSPYGCRSNAPCSLNKQKMVIKYIHMLWPTWAGSGVGSGPHGRTAGWGGGNIYVYIYLICCGQAGFAMGWAGGSGLWLCQARRVQHMAAEAMPHVALINKNGNKIHTYVCKYLHIYLVCCGQSGLAVM